MQASALVDMSGERFGALVAQRHAGRSGRRTVWEFLCDCGSTCLRTRDEILQSTRRHGQISCGCKRNEYIARAKTTHGMSRTKEHRAWSGMKSRCLNPSNKSYARYGGRGIGVYGPWIDSFEAFLAHIGPAPSPKHSVDRIDNNGNYEPGNVRWATHVDQARNRRSNVQVTLYGQDMILADAAAALGVSFGAVARRAAATGDIDPLWIKTSRKNQRGQYPGVYPRRGSGRYLASCWSGEKLVYVGDFDSPEEAHIQWLSMKVLFNA